MSDSGSSSTTEALVAALVLEKLVSSSLRASKASVISREALRSSLSPCPIDFPISGSFFGPKTISASARITISSGPLGRLNMPSDSEDQLISTRETPRFTSIILLFEQKPAP
jgi:hypothetical protein